MTHYEAKMGVCGMIDIIGPEGGVCVCADMFRARELARKLNHYEELLEQHRQDVAQEQNTKTTTNNHDAIIDAAANIAAEDPVSEKERTNGLNHLRQGLLKGFFDSDSMLCIAANTPSIAAAIAEGMGMTTADLMRQSKRGKVPAESIISAIAKHRGETQ